MRLSLDKKEFNDELLYAFNLRYRCYCNIGIGNHLPEYIKRVSICFMCVCINWLFSPFIFIKCLCQHTRTD